MTIGGHEIHFSNPLLGLTLVLKSQLCKEILFPNNLRGGVLGIGLSVLEKLFYLKTLQECAKGRFLQKKNNLQCPFSPFLVVYVAPTSEKMSLLSTE